jgi:hypothetical protein
VREARGVAVVVACASLVTGAATLIATPACSTHKCDQAETVTVVAGADDGVPAGFLHDPDTWESNPMDAPWRAYFHEQVLVLDFGAAPRREIENVAVYVSIAGAPLDAGDIIALATGNLAEITVNRTPPDDAGSGGTYHLNIHNNTCQDYYARVVVTFEHEDAGANGDASSDAAPDATDAGTE